MYMVTLRTYFVWQIEKKLSAHAVVIIYVRKCYFYYNTEN